MSTFVMAGGGTGGHVIPALAVARELRRLGHHPVFIGTKRGVEARLVPGEFPIEWIEAGALKRAGLVRSVSTLLGLPVAVWKAGRILDRLNPAAIFSMGGYVAGPVLMAAAIRRLPIVAMEPNAMAGFTHRRLARFVTRGLVSFEETRRFFPRTEVTGLPVRDEFFALPPKLRGETLTLLVTGGSQGSRTLNRAVEASWPLWGDFPIRLIHQTGAQADLSRQFAGSKIEGEVAQFIVNMPEKFAEADLVVCRAGAGTVSELAAAGKPSILVPFPYAADDHQAQNAEAFARAGAARLIRDQEMTGERLVAMVKDLAGEPGRLAAMGLAARQLAHPGAAKRAAEILLEVAEKH
jgi:UDP-N-acetylglucosamine--N-acetylmuramyl-(pentapeptide) pyrophosphoryl-undecaprenol N-acetylglucosamine transferase